MHEPPDDVTDADVLTTLREHWCSLEVGGLLVDEVTHLPVGFGAHHFDLRQKFVRVIQFAILQNIHFRAGQHANPQILFVHVPQRLQMRHQPLLIQPIGNRQRLRVVGNRDVLVPQLPRRLGILRI